jgi:hypothetical protein
MHFVQFYVYVSYVHVHVHILGAEKTLKSHNLKYTKLYTLCLYNTLRIIGAVVGMSLQNLYSYA